MDFQEGHIVTHWTFQQDLCGFFSRLMMSLIVLRLAAYQQHKVWVAHGDWRINSLIGHSQLVLRLSWGCDNSTPLEKSFFLMLISLYFGNCNYFHDPSK